MSFIQSGIRWACAIALSIVICTFVPSTVLGQKKEEAKPAPAFVPRAENLKTLHDYFPMKQPCDAKEWEQRRMELRRQILVSNGLWPMPTQTPLRPIIHGMVDRGDYTVSRVIFESVPGFYVTGSLYLPKGIDPCAKKPTQKIPAVLCPHGHWTNGRFYEEPAETFQKKSLAGGGEMFVSCGRYPVQARCVTLTRMGCAVFFYDMIGYADSVQFSHHRPGVRPEMNTKERWGFFSPQAELRLQNMMGLQTWSSIRALDWLESLPFVDTKRIGVTGCSGGGTQTFVLGAVDPRPAVTLPAVMVSTAMQGGCTCENATYLRVDSGNIDIAACRAPLPMGLTAADDWTVEMEIKGFPDIKRVYEFSESGSNVALFPHLQFGHNYNFVSRSEMYRWMNRYLKLGFDEAKQLDYGTEKRKHKTAKGDDVVEEIPIRSFEKEFKPLSVEEATVWTGKYYKPAGGAVGELFERSLTAWLDMDSKKTMSGCMPKVGDGDAMKRFRVIIGGGWQVLIGRQFEEIDRQGKPAVVDQVVDAKRSKDDGKYLIQNGYFENKLHRERVPFTSFVRKGLQAQEVKYTAIVTTAKGKSGVFDENGKFKPGIVRLLDKNVRVVTIDLFGQGESLYQGKELVNAPMGGYGQKNQLWQQALCYTYGYNHPVFSKRVHDIMTTALALRNDIKSKKQSSKLVLIALDGTGKYGAAAGFVCGKAIDAYALDTNGFRFANITRLDDLDMVPGAVKYGDVPLLLALVAPRKMILFDSESGSEAFDAMRIAYKAKSKKGNLLTVSTEKNPVKQFDAIMEWLR
ncbi:MAG: hypothetical protein Q4G59_03685 [Planctomycetia bacterium]|nr:hypothetical protein [Planctomycetia bacterium]